LEAIPAEQPQGSDEAKLLGDSRWGFTSRFADYELHETNKYGESFAEQWGGPTADVGAGPAAADFDLKRAYTKEFVDQINDRDRGSVTLLDWKVQTKRT
jgi:hypothetical protein